MKRKKIILIILISLCFYPQINAQLKNPGLGAAIGLGEIKGNSPGISAFTGGLFLSAVPWFSDDVQFRFGFAYSRRVEYFLPENRTGRYYAFIKSFYLKAVLDQQLNNMLFAEEGAGILTINDRTFSNTNTWDYGAGFHALIGFDFTDENIKGIRISGGIDSGITFTQTTASYFLFIVQLHYLF